MSDLIRREDAIEAVAEYISCDYPTISMAEEDAKDLINTIPSADRPRGEWKVFDAEDIGCYNCKCDACGEKFFIPLRKGRVPYYFCPNCGAQMKGADDEVR